MRHRRSLVTVGAGLVAVLVLLASVGDADANKSPDSTAGASDRRLQVFPDPSFEMPSFGPFESFPPVPTFGPFPSFPVFAAPHAEEPCHGTPQACGMELLSRQPWGPPLMIGVLLLTVAYGIRKRLQMARAVRSFALVDVPPPPAASGGQSNAADGDDRPDGTANPGGG